MSDQVSVQVALARVLAEMPAIGKTDEAKELGYKFRGIEALTAVVQPLLAKHGVVIVPQVRSLQLVKSEGSKHPAMQDTILHVEWQIVGPDGSSLTASTWGIGRDHTDKGANKAQTQAFKYLLLHLFCISDPKDDADGRDADAEAPRPEATADEIAGDRVAQRVGEVAQRLGVGSALREFGGTHGKGFGGDALTDPEWRALVEAKLDELEASA